jgi:hypothetical protein
MSSNPPIIEIGGDGRGLFVVNYKSTKPIDTSIGIAVL